MSNTVGNNGQIHPSPCWDYDSSGAMKQSRVRVALRGEATDVYDFNTGRQLYHHTLPGWMRDSIALLNIAGQGVEVHNVGMKWADDTYYLTIKGDLGEAEQQENAGGATKDT